LKTNGCQGNKPAPQVWRTRCRRFLTAEQRSQGAMLSLLTAAKAHKDNAQAHNDDDNCADCRPTPRRRRFDCDAQIFAVRYTAARRGQRDAIIACERARARLERERYVCRLPDRQLVNRLRRECHVTSARLLRGGRNILKWSRADVVDYKTHFGFGVAARLCVEIAVRRREREIRF